VAVALVARPCARIFFLAHGGARAAPCARLAAAAWPPSCARSVPSSPAVTPRRDVSLCAAALLAEPLHRALLVRQVAPWPRRALCSSSLSFPSVRRFSQPPRAVKLPGYTRVLHCWLSPSPDSSVLSCAGFVSSR
jgi:hypothetical protein